MTTTYRPSEAPRLLQAYKGLIVAGTGHRPDKLGGYGNEANNRPVRKFSGTPLSNFAPCEVTLGGQTYTSVEAAYQAAKTLDLGERARIRAAGTPALAKALGRNVTLRADWNAVRVQVMRDLLRQKFSTPHYAQVLADTGTGMLEEGNTWGDTFWGTVNGVGENTLGCLLMELRAELRVTRTTLDPFAALVEVAAASLTEIRPAAVISGMALGWDQALAYAALECGIPLIAAVPFPKQPSRWPEVHQKRWAYLLSKAQLVFTVGSDELADADIKLAMNWRNEFMVNSAQLILACFDGTAGGTANCVQYAEKAGRPVVNTYGRWTRLTGREAPAAPTAGPARCWVRFPDTHRTPNEPQGWFSGELVSEHHLPGRSKSHPEFNHVYVVNYTHLGQRRGVIVPTTWVSMTPVSEPDADTPEADTPEANTSDSASPSADAPLLPVTDVPNGARIQAVKFSAHHGRYGDTEVTATFRTGERSVVLTYFSDELHFSSSDFIGLTTEEVRALFHARDVAYLQR